MNTAEAAALIAAVFWALLVSVGVFVLFRLGRLMGESTRLIADLRERGDVLLQRAQVAVDGAQGAVDRASRQLDRSESVTASMDELGTGMAELAGQVTALAGLGRAIAAGPVGRVGALAYGVRHAVGLRRPLPRRGRPHAAGPRREARRDEPQRDEPRRDEPRRDGPRQGGPRRDGPRRTGPEGGAGMIRRGFWLTAGAVTGIYSYRRVSAAGRRLSASLNLAGSGASAAIGPRLAREAGLGRRGVIRLARETYRFGRDVREGMDLYLARPPATAGLTTLATDSTLTTERSRNFEPKDGQ